MRRRSIRYVRLEAVGKVNGADVVVEDALRLDLREDGNITVEQVRSDLWDNYGVRPVELKAAIDWLIS